jgi:hypothetical protein
MEISSALTVNIAGDVFGTARNSEYGILVSGSCILTINGDVRGGDSGASFTAHGIQVNAAAAITINGDCRSTEGAAANAGGAAVSVGTFSAVIDINGDVYSSATASIGTTASGFAALLSTSAQPLFRINGTIYTNPLGGWPIQVPRFLIAEGSNVTVQVRDDAASPIGGNLITLSVLGTNNPLPEDVRSGVLYGLDDQSEGTLIVPPPESVSAGVPVDDSVGTAVLSPNDVWGFDPTTVTTDSIGERLANVSTIESVGAQLSSALDSA